MCTIYEENYASHQTQEQGRSILGLLSLLRHIQSFYKLLFILMLCCFKILTFYFICLYAFVCVSILCLRAREGAVGGGGSGGHGGGGGGRYDWLNNRDQSVTHRRVFQNNRHIRKTVGNLKVSIKNYIYPCWRIVQQYWVPLSFTNETYLPDV